MKGIKVLLVYRHNASFIENDYKSLKKHFPTYKHKISFSPINFLKLLKLVKKVDIAIGWFASWGTAISLIISKFFGKKFIVIGGGLDTTWIRVNKKIKNLEISGLFELLEKYIARFVFNHSDFVLPVSNFSKNGILLVSKPKNIKVVYNGIPINKTSSKMTKKENIVITVGNLSKFNIKKKGLKFFAKVSRSLPSTKFFIIGKYNENSFEYRLLQSIGGKNLIFTNWLQKKDLMKLMKKAKVYCQLSLSESFGYALAEAMLCRCIPVVTNRTALPEVVGNTGFYVSYGNCDELQKNIEKALKMPNNFGNLARKRIIKYFSLERREKELCDIIYILAKKLNL